MASTGTGEHPGDGRAILLTGATGYIGGELLRALSSHGETVRCLVRDPSAFAHRMPPGCTMIQADLLVPDGLSEALAGINTAYYLVHSMGGRGDFAAMDRTAAHNFARAAQDAGVRRIIYLGGLAERGEQPSAHLASRLEVREILRSCGIPVVEFQASIILGPGSLSFEIMRALVERLPVMVTPRWVRTPCQPIAADDLLTYLTAALDLSLDGSLVVQIGGAEPVAYGALMKEYARQRGLPRLIIPVPVLTPWLSGLWLGLITPVQAAIGRRVIDGLSTPTVVRDSSAARFSVRPKSASEAIRWGLAEEERRMERLPWRELARQGVCRHRSRGCRLEPQRAASGRCSRRVLTCTNGHRLMDSRSVQVDCAPEEAFEPIHRIGGETGWYCGSAPWRLRGLLDRLVGGPGHCRLRTNPAELREDDQADSWRVVLVEPGRRLRLRSEMRMPGRAWLELLVTGDGPCRISQTALFDPKGLTGLLYWYAMAPFHEYLFPTMLSRIARQAAECRMPVETHRRTGGAPGKGCPGHRRISALSPERDPRAKCAIRP